MLAHKANDMSECVSYIAGEKLGKVNVVTIVFFFFSIHVIFYVYSFHNILIEHVLNMINIEYIYLYVKTQPLKYLNYSKYF